MLKPVPDSERGAALAVSLIFLLLMTMAAIAAVQAASSQERMAANSKFSNDSLQAAEAGLRQAEVDLFDNFAGFATPCSGADCNIDASIYDPATQSRPSNQWIEISPSTETNNMTLWYRVINLGQSNTPVNIARPAPGTLYRVVVVSFRGSTRTVLEAIYVQSEA
ncbi:pilus assembly PilX family protein [Halopseudomonas salegens]|uniref:Type IV pilus assembly protein PilX n=1 Tax=Halopseudomonas salegens TaxID=1434072 RepID=A0A1H2GLI8_9GAMM|nr:PilX N-terminal domain-containing pilus assembly protein [Halopseudomonas salegens]SDU20450.1 type IV pilus assembly protein PilX [Halopseudomonas salegens]